MAPTAAMLILSSHPHHNKTNSSLSLPSPSIPAATFWGRVPVARWVSEKTHIIFNKPISVDDHKHENYKAADVGPTREALLEKRFEEALQHSYW